MQPIIEWHSDTNEWTATAPEGYRFEAGLHELIESAAPVCGLIPAEWKREAKRELLERLSQMPLEVCDDPDCEWCGDAIPDHLANPRE